MSDNMDTLRKTAEAATPGPWEASDRGIGYEVHDASGYELNSGMRETFTESDATHIATFDPPTVLALLSRLERAEADVVNWKSTAVSRGERLEQAEQAVERAKAECARQREHKGVFARRADAAEQAVQRVREVCESGSFTVLTEYGDVQRINTEDVLEALDGEPDE